MLVVFVSYWILIGLTVYIGTYLVETKIVSQNPELLDKLRQGLKRDDDRSNSSTVLYVVFWPVLLYFTILATRRGMSLSEYFLTQDEKKEKKKDYIWVDRKGDDFKISVLLCQYKLGTKIVHTMTHILLESNTSKTIGCWRMPFSSTDPDRIAEFFSKEHQSPNMQIDNLKQAKSRCEGDDSWIEVCGPGRESERLTKWEFVKKF